MSKTTDMLLVEIRDPKRRDIKTLLRDTYAEEGSFERAGKRLGIDASTYCRWTQRLDVKLPRSVRRRREAAKEAVTA
jgi:hypothetical protein